MRLLGRFQSDQCDTKSGSVAKVTAIRRASSCVSCLRPYSIFRALLVGRVDKVSRLGFDPAQKLGRRSFGLTAMRERVEVLGGRILVESSRAGPFSRAHGTRIEVGLPLTAAAEK